MNPAAEQVACLSDLLTWARVTRSWGFGLFIEHGLNEPFMIFVSLIYSRWFLNPTARAAAAAARKLHLDQAMQDVSHQLHEQLHRHHHHRHAPAPADTSGTSDISLVV